MVSTPDKIFSVPIVPLTEENETAMEDPVFMDFLRGLGLSPPANEQVGFVQVTAMFLTLHGSVRLGLFPKQQMSRNVSLVSFRVGSWLGQLVA